MTQADPDEGRTLDPTPLHQNVAHTLAPVQALSSAGEPVRLGTLWEDQIAILVFLRHFG